MQPSLGVDLGTTNSVVALSQQKNVEILPLGPTHSGLFPSLLGPDGQALSFLQAGCFHDFKREMETPDKELAPGVTPRGLTTALCRALRQASWQALGAPAERIVLTVPARFSDRARKATKEAAQTAGFQVIRLLNEPTAAALAYGLNHKKEGLFLVYDLGGGTFDATLLRIQGDVFQILATSGDLFLGGHTLDQAIVRWWKQDVNDPLWLKKARHLKESLSDPSFVSEELPREVFDALARELLLKTRSLVTSMLEETLLRAEDVEGVVLVGGSTRLPQVVPLLRDLFRKASIYQSLDPDRAVAIGAALHAEALTAMAPQDRPLLLDVIPASLGLETAMGIVENILPRYTPTPVQTTVPFSTMVDNQTEVLIHVLQGDAIRKEGCVSLGKFILKGIPPMPKGQPKINVTFQVNEDGILTVQAEELLSDTRQRLVLEEYFS